MFPILLAGVAAAALLGTKKSSGAGKAKTKRVSFVATKKASAPTDVKFSTKDGKKVRFRARKKIDKKVRVNFRAKSK